MRTGKMILWLLIVTALLAACASGTALAQNAGSLTPVKTNQVSMPPSYRFDPVVIQVKIGDTVTWTNKDNFTHDVHLMGGIDWTSQPLKPGESATYTFKSAGTFPYQCDFHAQNMKGEVIVANP